MKNAYTKSDCQELRRLLIKRAQDTCGNSDSNCLLLSGGMDSTTALYSLLGAGVKFKAYTFYIDGWESQDLKAVQSLQKQIGFPVEYIPIKSNYDEIKDDLKKAVKKCYDVYKKIREVKTETIFAMINLEKRLPEKCNVVLADFGDSVLGYTKTIGKIIYLHGEESKWSLDARSEVFDVNEYNGILFNENRMRIEMFMGEPMKFLLNFTASACNKRFPKSICYYAFFEEHNKYHSYRKPKSFHKACNEKAMFNLMAMERGYKNSYEFFKAIHKEMGE